MKKGPTYPTFSHQNYYVGKKFITTYPTTTYIPYYRFINGNAPQKLSHPNWSDNFSRFSLLEKRFVISMDPLKWVMLLMLPFAAWKILNQNWTPIGRQIVHLLYLCTYYIFPNSMEKYWCDILVTFPSHLKKITFYTEILTRKVELWIFSLVSLLKKHHKTTFPVKISV